MVELNKNEEMFLKALLKVIEKDSFTVYNMLPCDATDDNKNKIFSEEQIANFDIYINHFHRIGFIDLFEDMTKFYDVFGNYFLSFAPKAITYFEDKKKLKAEMRKEKNKDRLFEFIMVVVGAFLGALLSKFI